MTAKPITPKEAFESADVIPDRVLEVWNKLIVKHRSGRSSVVTQDEAVEAIRSAMGTSGDDYYYECPRQKVFDEGWLEIEGVFGKAGWNVEYDKPAYCETYPATFTFTPKRGK